MSEEREFPWLVWVTVGIAISFVLGVVLFLTVARGRIGDPIPPDAGPASVDTLGALELKSRLMRA